MPTNQKQYESYSQELADTRYNRLGPQLYVQDVTNKLSFVVTRHDVPCLKLLYEDFNIKSDARTFNLQSFTEIAKGLGYSDEGLPELPEHSDDLNLHVC